MCSAWSYFRSPSRNVKRISREALIVSFVQGIIAKNTSATERIEAQRETTSRNWVAADTRGTGGAAQGTLYLVIVPWLFPPKTNPIAIFWFRFCSFVYTWYCLIEVVHPEVWDLGQHAQQKSRMSCWVKLKGDETFEASLGICMHDLFQHISNHHILDVLCLIVFFFPMIFVHPCVLYYVLDHDI